MARKRKFICGALIIIRHDIRRRIAGNYVINLPIENWDKKEEHLEEYLEEVDKSMWLKRMKKRQTLLAYWNLLALVRKK